MAGTRDRGVAGFGPPNPAQRDTSYLHADTGRHRRWDCEFFFKGNRKNTGRPGAQAKSEDWISDGKISLIQQTQVLVLTQAEDPEFQNTFAVYSGSFFHCSGVFNLRRKVGLYMHSQLARRCAVTCTNFNTRYIHPGKSRRL